MTTPSPADGLRECLALLDRATAGEWEAFNDGAHHRAVVRCGLTPIAEMWMVGQPEDERQASSQAIAAAVNFLRDHGPALATALRLREGLDATSAALVELSEAAAKLRADVYLWRLTGNMPNLAMLAADEERLDAALARFNGGAA